MFMTKQELESLLKDFGSKGKEIATKVYDTIEEEKEKLDTETRRKVRKFWICVSIVTFVVGSAVGYVL